MKRASVIVTSLVVAISVLVCSLPYLDRLLHRDDWKKRTDPLPKETRELLCDRFGLPLEGSLCNGNKDVYALDFMPTIRDTFQPYEIFGLDGNEAETYELVEEKIGEFRYECEPVVYQADGFTYFVCRYDLRGDREFIITIFYSYPEKVVVRLGSTSKFDE